MPASVPFVVIVLLLSAAPLVRAQDTEEWPPAEPRPSEDEPAPAAEPEPRSDSESGSETDPREARRPEAEARERAEREARARLEAAARERAQDGLAPGRDPLEPARLPPSANAPKGSQPVDALGAVPTPEKPELGVLGGWVALELHPWVVTDVGGGLERERQRLGLEWRLDRDLDVDDEAVGQVGSFEIRFTPLLSVRTEYLRVRPSGKAVLDEGNVFNGRVFQAGERVKTEIDFQQVRVDVGFGWSTDLLTVQALVGVRQFFATARIESRDGPARSKSQTRLTSPEVGARLELHLGDPRVVEFGGHFRTALFAFPEIDANGYEAAWFDLEAGVQATFFGIVKVQAGLRYLTAYLRTDHGGDEEKAELHLFGPVAGVSVLF